MKADSAREPSDVALLLLCVKYLFHLSVFTCRILYINQLSYGNERRTIGTV